MFELENPQLEMSVLGALISNSDLFYKVSDILTPDCFTKPFLEKMFECFKTLHEETGKVNHLQLYHHFAKITDNTGEELKQNIVDIVTSSTGMVALGVRSHAKILVDLQQKRLLKAMFAKLERSIFDSEKDATTVAAEAISEATKVISHGAKDSSLGIREAFEGIYQVISSPEPSYKARTGLKPVDIGMAGGMQRGRVYAFLAAAKVGKTLLATTISNNLCDNGFKHLFVCAEMGSNEICERMLGQRLFLPTRSFRERKDNQLKELVADQIVKLQNNVIFEDEPGIEFDRLKAVIEKHVHKNKIEGFILDYYQLVSGQERHQTQAQHLEEVANWVHRVCKKNNIWALLLVQTNDLGQVLGSRGLDRACDQKYTIERPLDKQGDPIGNTAWLKMKASRYTPLLKLGDENNPSLRIHPNGTHFEAF